WLVIHLPESSKVKKVKSDPKALKVLLALKALRVIKATQVSQVLKAIKAIPVLRALQVPEALQELRATQVLKAIKATPVLRATWGRQELVSLTTGIGQELRNPQRPIIPTESLSAIRIKLLITGLVCSPRPVLVIPQTMSPYTLLNRTC